jgi:peptidoglycan hydrolase CwlO-like protein
MDMNMIATIMVAILIFLVVCTPIVLLTILIVRTNKPKIPQNKMKLEQLEQNDYQIADDVNKAFDNFASDLESVMKRLDEIEGKMDREENTVEGFNSKR